jgi:hypothetical protein
MALGFLIEISVFTRGNERRGRRAPEGDPDPLDPGKD